MTTKNSEDIDHNADVASQTEPHFKSDVTSSEGTEAPVINEQSVNDIATRDAKTKTEPVDSDSTIAKRVNEQGLSAPKLIATMVGMVFLFGLLKVGMGIMGSPETTIDVSNKYVSNPDTQKIAVVDVKEMFAEWSKEAVLEGEMSTAAQELGQLYFDMGYLVLDANMVVRTPAAFKMNIPPVSVLISTKAIREQYVSEGKAPPKAEKLIEMALAMQNQENP
ncbi:hypothetical protein L5M38_20480 [Shewanella sp. SM101]|jgi:hypothetical protein|uniref:hypothetical protein n=1 Tax=Shewanella TaxID=22 RepID=UPI0002112D8A|nr:MULTISPECIES: hypothetical protein [Shewanella]AEH16225.1 hypothetical protein Sbal117_4587 [Shewanella baltica OS117]MCU8008948.1 hypothetical protein [Shewanella sp. SM87]MCU8106899.1 hypothetical protein [Shewanella sp. SM101]